MHWISFLPRAIVPRPADSADEADPHAADARDCAIAMAAYLPPGGGIVAGGCFMQLLDLMDGTTPAPVAQQLAGPGSIAIDGNHAYVATAGWSGTDTYQPRVGSIIVRTK